MSITNEYRRFPCQIDDSLFTVRKMGHVMAFAIDDQLEDFADIWKEIGGGTPILLLGNGASRAISEKFAYQSLFNIACDRSRANHLTPEDIEFFRDLDDTRNFELVLSSLTTAIRVNEVLGIETVEIHERYDSIRHALISAVKDIHVLYKDVPDTTKAAICAELSRYSAIYSTNYDLLIYWSIMALPRPLRDFFWGSGQFDPGDCELHNSDVPALYYLHGALHLYKATGGHTAKYIAGDSHRGLLDHFNLTNREVPLFISEGTWRDKKSAILRNDYLSFCFRSFRQNSRNIVVFGQSLDDKFDHHLVDAMTKMRNGTPWNPQVVAFSIRPSNPPDPHAIIETKTRLTTALANKRLRFFDSRSHPLGDEGLQIR